MMAEKKLGFGLMRLPLKDAKDTTSIDHETVCKMADEFLKAGFTYFDTAQPYHEGASEIAFRECVAKRYPRDAYTITNKLSLFVLKKKEEIPGFFVNQLEHCGVEYFDYYLVHSLDKASFQQAEEWGAFDFVSQKKAEGKVRHIGFSFHDKADVLEEILKRHPEMEYVQLQINYMDWENPNVQSRKCYEVCQKYNKTVLIMEPVKGGMLVNVPEEAKQLLKENRPELSVASWAIRYAASLENVKMVLSGMSNPEQMQYNLSYMKELQPVSDEEKQVIHKVVEILNSKATIACTSCRYCVDGCPQKIEIPKYFALLNDLSRYGDAQMASLREDYGYYLDSGYGKASSCIKCRKCESHCPQHLPITAYLEDVAKVMEVNGEMA